MNTTKLTYFAKQLVLPALVSVLSFSSCKKDIQSVDWNNNAIKNNNGTSLGLSEDEKLRHVTIDFPSQVVKTYVEGSTLKLVYTESINVVLDAKGYDLSYSIRLNEDFAASALNGLQYTVPAPNGTHTTGWHGNDLKVLDEVTKTSVVVNGRSMIRLNLVRNFTFITQMASFQDAINQQNALVNTKTNTIKFTSYVSFGKDYPSSTAIATLVYTK